MSFWTKFGQGIGAAVTGVADVYVPYMERKREDRKVRGRENRAYEERETNRQIRTIYTMFQNGQEELAIKMARDMGDKKLETELMGALQGTYQKGARTAGIGLSGVTTRLQERLGKRPTGTREQRLAAIAELQKGRGELSVGRAKTQTALGLIDPKERTSDRAMIAGQRINLAETAMEATDRRIAEINEYGAAIDNIPERLGAIKVGEYFDNTLLPLWTKLGNSEKDFAYHKTRYLNAVQERRSRDLFELASAGIYDNNPEAAEQYALNHGLGQDSFNLVEAIKAKQSLHINTETKTELANVEQQMKHAQMLVARGDIRKASDYYDGLMSSLAEKAKTNKAVAKFLTFWSNEDNKAAYINASPIKSVVQIRKYVSENLHSDTIGEQFKEKLIAYKARKPGETEPLKLEDVEKLVEIFKREQKIDTWEPEVEFNEAGEQISLSKEQEEEAFIMGSQMVSFLNDHHEDLSSIAKTQLRAGPNRRVVGRGENTTGGAYIAERGPATKEDPLGKRTISQIRVLGPTDPLPMDAQTKRASAHIQQEPPLMRARLIENLAKQGWGYEYNEQLKTFVFRKIDKAPETPPPEASPDLGAPPWMEPAGPLHTPEEAQLREEIGQPAGTLTEPEIPLPEEPAAPFLPRPTR